MKSIFLTLFITLTQTTPSCNDYCILDMGYPAGGELLGTSSCTASCNDCDEDCVEEDTDSGGVVWVMQKISHFGRRREKLWIGILGIIKLGSIESGKRERQKSRNVRSKTREN